MGRREFNHKHAQPLQPPCCLVQCCSGIPAAGRGGALTGMTRGSGSGKLKAWWFTSQPPLKKKATDSLTSAPVALCASSAAFRRSGAYPGLKGVHAFCCSSGWVGPCRRRGRGRWWPIHQLQVL